MSHDRDVKFCDCGKELWDGTECDCQKSASDYQVGGDHYKSEYQHWDWTIDIRLGYLESAATKYVTRWRGKNGPQDVEKAIHYLSKAKEAFLERRYHNGSTMLSVNKSLAALAAMNTERFCVSNNLTIQEQRFMTLVSRWKTEVNLDAAIDLATDIQAMAVEAAGAANGGAARVAPTTGLKRPTGQKTGGSGQAGGPTTQGVASSASVDVASRGIDGQEHPFGYNAEEEGYVDSPECDFSNYRKK